MMSYKRIIPFLILFFIGPCGQRVMAQALNIAGDTIFVNAEAEIQIIFPTPPKGFSTVPNNSPYHIRIAGKRANIIAGSQYKNADPATLLVSEGGRNHIFIVAFKKDINYNNASEIFHDYSTEKKIEQHIRETALGKTAAPEKTVVNPNSKAEPVDNPSTYYALLEQGEKDLKQENLGGAKAYFDRAHILRPDDAIPLQRLEEVKTKLAAKEKSGLSVNETDYSAIIAGAINYLSQKKYTLARDAYKQALALRPGDLYATRQLETINSLLPETSEQKEQQKNKESYDEYISQGEKAFNKNQLADARKAYEQALTVRQNDVVATSRLKLIEEKEKSQKDKETLENNYKNLIESADKYYREGDFSNARIEYNKAIGIIKKLYPQEQVKKIDKILVEQTAREKVEKQKLAEQLQTDSLQKEKQALEDSYAAAVQVADKYFKEGDYENAKMEYSKAIGIIKKPYSQEQVRKIDKILADQVAKEKIEKEKRMQQLLAEGVRKEKQALEDRYTAVIQLADKYFKQGDYENAKIEYNKADGIIKKPYSQEQVKKIDQILAEQIAKEKLEKQKLAQQLLADSLEKAKQALEDRYAAVVKVADKYFKEGDYENAKIEYNKADGIIKKPYSQEQVKKIDKIVAEQIAKEKLEKQRLAQQKLADSLQKAKQALEDSYAAVIQLADKYFKQGDYEKAKIEYNKADGIIKKPYSQEQVKKIDKIVAEQIAKEKLEKQRLAQQKLADSLQKERQALEDRYAGAIQLADKYFKQGDYENAKTEYNKALTLMKRDWPREQIKEIDRIVARLAAHENTESQEKQEQNRKNKYNTAMESADKFFVAGDYANAKIEYDKANSIIPNSLAQEQIKKNK